MIGIVQNQTSMLIFEAILMEQSMYIASKIKVISEIEQMSPGWFMSFKKYHDIKQRAVCSEAGTVDQNVIWKRCLNKEFQNFNQEIFLMLTK